MNNRKTYLVVTVLALILISIGVLLLGFGILLGNKLNNWFPIFIGLGIGFLPTGIISLTIRLALAKEFNQEMTITLKKILSTEFKQIYNLKDAGIEDYYKKFPSDELYNLISNTSKSIFILNTWVPNFIELQSAFEIALKQGCNIKILVLDPTSELISTRATQLGLSKKAFISSINSTIDYYETFIDSLPKGSNISLRKYNEWVGVSIYKFDDSIFFGLYLSKRHNLSGSYFKLKECSGAHLSNAIYSHFEMLWENSTSIENLKCAE